MVSLTGIISVGGNGDGGNLEVRRQTGVTEASLPWLAVT